MERVRKNVSEFIRDDDRRRILGVFDGCRFFGEFPSSLIVNNEHHGFETTVNIPRTQ